MSAALASPLAAPVWLTQAEVLALTRWTTRWLRAKDRSEQIVSRETGDILPNGRRARMYLASSLPATVQAKVQPPQRALPAPAALAPSPLTLAAPVEAVSSAPKRIALDDPDDRALALRRRDILQPLLDFKADPGRFRDLRTRDGRAVQTLAQLATWISENTEEAVSVPTLWRWKRGYEEQGLPGLARKPHPGRGRSKWAAENRALADLAAFVYFGDSTQPSQSITVAWEQVSAAAERTGVPPPSYKTIRAFLENPAEVSASMKTLQLKGRKAYEAHFAPYIRRGYTEPANSIWVSDHMIADTLVQDDCIDRDLRHCRLQMTALLDYRSRFFVGLAWSRNGSSHSIRRAVMRAILKFGPPETFYCDNGKDYRKVANGAHRQQMQADADARVDEMRALAGDVLQRLQIPVVFCKPFHPQSKHIERVFRTLHGRVDRSFATYTGGAPHLRPDATTAGLARHKKLLHMGDTGDSSLPLASEYIRMAEAWIEHVYHRKPHSGAGMNDRSPADCFHQEFNPRQRPIPPFEELALLLAEHEKRMVHNCGVEIRGTRFVPAAADQRAAVTMHELSGRRQQVIVAFDPLDMSYAAVRTLDGQALCRLERQNLTRFSQDEETGAEIAAMSQQRGMLAKATRESVADLGRRVRSEGYVSQADQLRALADLPATGTDPVVQRPRRAAPASAPAQVYVNEAVESFFSERTK